MLRNLEFAKEAVEEGYDINKFNHRKSVLWDNYSSDNPLLVSIFNGCSKISDYLIESGADVNYVCSNGKSILYYLTEYGVDPYCEKVINKGADVNFVNKEGKSVLQCAIESNLSDVIIMLLNEEDIIVTKENIDTAIINISEKKYYNCYEYLKKLLEHNNNVDSQIYNSIFDCKNLKVNDIDDNYKELIAGAVAVFGESNVLNEIIENNNVDTKRLYLLACKYGNIGNVEYLLSKGVDINFANEIGMTAVEIAVENNQNEVTKYLLNNGATVIGRKNTNYDDILTRAVKNDNYEITKLLINNYNNNLNIDKALMEAALESSSALKALLDTGISPDYTFYGNSNLLSYACLTNNYKGAKVLLEYGANPNGHINIPPLLMAVEYGNLECVKILCEYKVDIDYNIKGSGDTTSALYYAIKGGYLDIAQVLIENGATLKDQNELEKLKPYAEKSKNINKFLEENNLI